MTADPDKVIRARMDKPMFTWKWMRDHERSWERSEMPSGRRPKCEVFRDDYERCADGLSWERAKKECRLEYEDVMECIQMNKMKARNEAILKQRNKLIKEGKYTAPPFPESYPMFGDKND